MTDVIGLRLLSNETIQCKWKKSLGLPAELVIPDWARICVTGILCVVLKQHHCQPGDVARPLPVFLCDPSSLIAPARLMMLTVPHKLSVTVALLESFHLLWLKGRVWVMLTCRQATLVQVDASAQAYVAVHD